jgi:hypothetical protein
MAEGNYIFQMAPTSKAHLMTAKLLEEDDSLKRTETFMREISMATKQKEKEHLEILEEYIKDSLRMERSMEMGYTKVKMEYFSKEDSRMVNNHKASLFGELKINILTKEH